MRRKSSVGSLIIILLLLVIIAGAVAIIAKATNNFSDDVRTTVVSDGKNTYMYDDSYVVKSVETTLNVSEYSSNNVSFGASISANTEKDFTFIVDGVIKSWKTEFSGVDLSTFFSLSVSTDTIKFSFPYTSMSDFLKSYYAADVSLNTAVDISTASYFDLVFAQKTSDYTITLHLLYGITSTSLDSTNGGTSSGGNSNSDNSGTSSSGGSVTNISLSDTKIIF
jgi:hypothetical protein